MSLYHRSGLNNMNWLQPMTNVEIRRTNIFEDGYDSLNKFGTFLLASSLKFFCNNS